MYFVWNRLCRNLASFAVASCLAAPVWAVGSSDEPESPPSTTETTTECETGKIWDEAVKECVLPEDATDDQAALFRDARELAWANRFDEALHILDLLETTDSTLTYQGFIARQRGDWDQAESYYLAALERNPDNSLARSYYGQGLAKLGLIDAAQAQLSEIRRRGGRMTWPAIALRLTIDTADPAY